MRRFWAARKRAAIKELGLIALVFVAGIALQLWRGHSFGEAVERALPYLLGVATAGIVIVLFVPSWLGESTIRDPRSDEMIPPTRSRLPCNTRRSLRTPVLHSGYGRQPIARGRRPIPA